MAIPPTGTVAFLFTDVAGSTRLWDADRQGMATSLATHDRIMQRAIADHGGYVFATAGDSFAAAFPTASAALEAAVEAQLALLAESWNGPPIRVRMGIHIGSAQERAGNYFGPDVNRAARIMSAANGGQVLVSDVTAQLMASTDQEYALQDRGVHSLKDLDRPEHLFELRHPRLPEVDQPLKTAGAERAHLPAQLTSFVGRRAELEEVTGLLESARLVTLTGVGGTGKTRLSIEAASEIQDRFPDGVWMAELAPISDSALVINEVADLWGLRPGEGVDLIRVVKSHLSARTLLIVLDNCEHVLEAAASMVSEVLAASPGLTVLATSRESLGLPGEAVYRVPSLGLPSDQSDPGDSDAVHLFLDRASRLGSEISPSELDSVVRICRRLDGIPLGIELAVARLRTLSPAELADRLEDSFRILTRGSKSAVPRQRTLQTTIDWSYDLLDHKEAHLFRRLSVFAGGFDLAAAEAIATGEVVEEWQILDLVDQLVDQSLLNASHAGPQTRFVMLESIRQYSQERLVATGDAEDLFLAHARHYAAYVAEMEPRLRGPDQSQANDDLVLEIDNIRQALSTLLDRGEIDQVLETCFDLGFFWAQSGLLVEGREMLLSGLQSAGGETSPARAAKAWFLASLLATYLTDPRTVEYADRGLEAARASGDDALVGWLSLMRGTAYSNLVGLDDTNQHWFEEGLKLIEDNPGRPMWDPEYDAALMDFLMAFGRAGSADDQRRHTEGAIGRAKALGDRSLAGYAMGFAAYVDTDDSDWVLATLREGCEIQRGPGFRHGLGHTLFYLGSKMQDFGVGDGNEELGEGSNMLAEVGDLPCSTWSAARLIRSLLDSGEVGEARRSLATAVNRLLVYERDVSSDLPALACRMALAHGDLTAAARLLGHIQAHHEVRGSGRGPRMGKTGDIDTCREAIKESLSEDEVDRLVAEGAAANQAQVLGWMKEVAASGLASWRERPR